MAWTKYNNPRKRRSRKAVSRTEADIIATKNMMKDKLNGVDLPLSFYDR